MTSANLDNGAFVATWSHDALLRASGSYLSCISRCGSPAFSDSRTFDAAGNVTSARTQFGGILTADVQGFCYDEQDRLIWAGTSGSPPSGCTQPVTPGSFGTAGYQAAYSYDPLGRLTSGPLGSYSYADPKHLHAATSIGSAWTGSYDVAGNLTCRAASSVSTCAGTQTGAQLTYNAQGSLAIWQNASSSPTTVANFLYDGQGNRVEQQLSQNGTTTTTIYVGNLEELVSSGSGMTTQTYYYANDHRIAMAVNGAFSYLASSGLGTVEVAIPASNLSAQVNQLYDPYGNLRYSSGAMPTDYGFTGQHADSTSGLDYYNARYYDPLAGQFTSADTLLPGGGYDVFGLSRYAYVEGNPVNRIDPTGQVNVYEGDDGQLVPIEDAFSGTYAWGSGPVMVHRGWSQHSQSGGTGARSGLGHDDGCDLACAPGAVGVRPYPDETVGIPPLRPGPVGVIIGVGWVVWTVIHHQAFWQPRQAGQKCDEDPYGGCQPSATFLQSNGYVTPPRTLPGFPDAVRARGKTPFGGGIRARWRLPDGTILEWDY